MEHHAPRRLYKAVLAGGIALGLALMAASPASASVGPSVGSVTLTATPAVEVGQVVDVAVNLVGAANVYSFDITLGFDPAQFAYVDGSASAGPAGGFDSVLHGTGSVSLVHTRLGSSPAIGGTIPATLSFRALAIGSGSITASVNLADTTGGMAAPITPVAAAPVAIAPAPVVATPAPSVSPEPSPSVSPPVSPSASPSAAPAGTGSSAASASQGDGSLAITGIQGVAILVVALALVALGVIVVVARRRSVSAR